MAEGHHVAYGRSGISMDRRLPRTVLEFVDVHCHCLPALDDGPESLEEAVALCLRLAEDHVSLVVATPHQLGRYEDRTDAPGIRRAVALLNGELRKRGIRLAVLPGAEVRLDERIDRMLARDRILTLADAGRYLLLELPSNVFIDIEPLLLPLARRGVRVILAHPERNVPLLRHPQALQEWLMRGVSLQVTAASLTGQWGRHVKRAAWRLVTQGWVSLVATDAHDEVSLPPRMTKAFEAVRHRLGEEAACLLCAENPARVVRGQRLGCLPAPSRQVAS
jgi:protein-tyrosine phosphatase